MNINVLYKERLYRLSIKGDIIKLNISFVNREPLFY
jgi:hypothetical protein